MVRLDNIFMSSSKQVCGSYTTGRRSHLLCKAKRLDPDSEAARNRCQQGCDSHVKRRFELPFPAAEIASDVLRVGTYGPWFETPAAIGSYSISDRVQREVEFYPEYLYG